MVMAQRLVSIWAIATVVFCFALTGCQKEAASTGVTTPEPAKVETTPSPAPVPAQPVKPAPVPAGTQPQVVSADSPKIQLEKTEHDFGVIGPETYNKCQFKFSNAGKSLLKIDHVQSTCGCTVPELTKKEYAPGESGVIEITFHAPSYAGATSKHLYVISNDPMTPQAEIVIKATVEVKVVVDPNRVELYLNKENAGIPQIKVKCLDNVPFAITSFTSNGQAITADFDPKNKAVEHVISPKVDISKLQELTAGVIQVGVDHPQAKQVMVSYTALPAFELRPPRIVLQNAEPGVAIIREVWIVNNYGQPFEIESMQSRSGYMKVVNQKKDKDNLGLEIEITPPKQEGPVRRYITDELNIKIKDGPTLTVRCSGWFKL
ncbi:MAG: DUF1573 domain-containing protein [Anaerohalosphaeraceae bacterium]